MARHHVGFTHHLRHPEAVNDIVGFEKGVNQGALGNYQLIGGDDLRVRVRVIELPPPLMPHYPNFKLANGTIIGDIAQVEHGINGSNQYREQEQRRANRPGDF